MKSKEIYQSSSTQLYRESGGISNFTDTLAHLIGFNNVVLSSKELQIYHYQNCTLTALKSNDKNILKAHGDKENISNLEEKLMPYLKSAEIIG